MDDLINRNAAIKLLEEWADDYSYLEVPVSSIAHKLNELPAAEKKGKWINGKCDQCGEHALFWAMSSGYCASNYCPNCGAKMEKENNESNNT